MHNKVIFTVLILTLILSGCWNKQVNDEIVKKTNNNDKINDEITQETQAIASLNGNNDETTQNKTNNNENNIQTESLKNWQIYEKPEMDVALKFHKDWWYQRDSQREKENNYKLFLGFAPDQKTLKKGSPYPIELYIVSNSEFEKSTLNNSDVITSDNDYKYVLLTHNNTEYKEILTLMKSSFKLLSQSTINYNIDEYNIAFKFSKINCIETNNPELCKEYFGDNISEEDLNLNIHETTETKKMQLPDSLTKSTSTKEIEWNEKYEEFRNELQKATEINISLKSNDIHKNFIEISKYYITNNSKGLSENNISTWNYCEAGCPIWPDKTRKDMIIWKYNLNPSSGAGSLCQNASAVKQYEGADYDFCELYLSILNNINISITNN